VAKARVIVVDERNLEVRQVQALENIATYLERLELLREYELGVRVEYDHGDPYVSKGPEKSDRDA
jgi:hypothetical protein